MRYEFIKQGFLECTELTWEDIDIQVHNEVQRRKCRIVGESYDDLTYILLDYQRFNPNISKIHQKMMDQYNLKVLHIYTSKNHNGKTFGRHCDNVDVLIVQSIGKMDYRFDDDQVISLQPGDGLYIPEGVYHDPISSEPRVTLSFSRS
jgi:ribosomal protein L16 Arg81 hydroxylase